MSQASEAPASENGASADPARLQEAAHGGSAVLVAMDEEAAPFLEACQLLAGPVDFGRARYWALEHRGARMLLVRTGIGLVNAASAATSSIALIDPSAIFSAGSAGGLRPDVEVGDLAIGTVYAYADADATAFGYARGQVPGMPETYPASALLLEAAGTVPPAAGVHHSGLMLAGGSFVTQHNVAEAREAFPEAISTDMETTAIAQVAVNLGVDFLSVRGISDLCGPSAEQEFHLAVETVAERSARAVLNILGVLRPDRAEHL